MRYSRFISSIDILKHELIDGDTNCLDKCGACETVRETVCLAIEVTSTLNIVCHTPTGVNNVVLHATDAVGRRITPEQDQKAHFDAFTLL